MAKVVTLENLTHGIITCPNCKNSSGNVLVFQRAKSPGFTQNVFSEELDHPRIVSLLKTRLIQIKGEEVAAVRTPAPKVEKKVEPAPVVTPDPEPEPESTPGPEAVTEPASEPVEEPASEPEPVAAEEATEEPAPKRRRGRRKKTAAEPTE